MRKVFKGSLELDAEWLRWTERDKAESIIMREIHRMVDPWYNSLTHEPATSVRFRQEFVETIILPAKEE